MSSLLNMNPSEHGASEKESDGRDLKWNRHEAVGDGDDGP